jgi:hypothetical protein
MKNRISFGHRHPVKKVVVKAVDPTTNVKKIRRELKAGGDLFHFALEKLRPRQARKLANRFVELGGQLVR